MIFRLFSERKWSDAANKLYLAVVRQARLPVFYTGLGVADSVDGRFDMISLHAFLAIRRLNLEGTRDGQRLAQVLFDVMFTDMDRNLREMGVGDLSVGKHVKQMAQAYYGRAASYDAALNADSAQMEEALRRNLYRNVTPTADQVAAMAAYVRAQAETLGAQPFETLRRGEIEFVPPSPPAVLQTGEAS